MKKAEIILALVAFVCLILNQFSIPEGGTLVLVSFGLLAILYMYVSFALFNDVSFRDMFKKKSYTDISFLRISGSVATGLFLSTALVGILFESLSWPGSTGMLIIGYFALLVVLIVGIFRYLKTKSDFYIRLFQRIALLVSMAMVLLLTGN